MKSACLVILFLTLGSLIHAQNVEPVYPKSLVDIDAFAKLLDEVKPHRAKRIISFDKFLKMSSEKNTVILDTRSKAMFDSLHVKGAIHLNFSDFTQGSLAQLIPDKSTKILIYCNNNFIEPVTLKSSPYFGSKAFMPELDADLETIRESITLALNIPTYINLFGYGYENVYELGELVYMNDLRIQFEGVAAKKLR